MKIIGCKLVPNHNMTTTFKCSWEDCTYVTEAAEPAVAIQLLSLHDGTHRPAATHPQAAQKSTAESVKRPSIHPAGTEEKWNYFQQRWEDYKQATRLQPNEIVVQLLECCEDGLREDLFRINGRLNTETEKKVLEEIGKLAVRPQNVLVARADLQSLRQDREETVRAFCARLRGQARVCKFTQEKECTCKEMVVFDYSDVMVRDAFIRGLADEDIRLEIVGQSKQDMTLDEVIQMAEARESGRRSAGQLLAGMPTTMSASSASSYRRDSRSKLASKAQSTREDPQSHCSYCGESGHGTSYLSRQKKCPAFNHTCSKCNIKHHYESKCRKADRKPTQPRTAGGQGQANSTFVDYEYDESCVVKNECSDTTSTVNAIVLDHHVYSDLTKTWERRSSDPHPYTTISAQYIPADVAELGVRAPCTTQSPMVSHQGMADTGCQSCLSGVGLLHKLGIAKENVIPVRMKMKAVNNKDIGIIGALPLRFTGFSSSGAEITTNQLVYFTDDASRLFLSKQACAALGIISENFPTIGEASAATATVETESAKECQCPKREPPPPMPTKPPYPLVPENVEKIQSWLLDYYKSSTFNVCEHQTLPMMSGPPLHLNIDPNATPVAHHKPIPIPVHWQEQVYAGLDRDCRLGVLEPVPIGTPVTWCHKMVVVAKKSGKPRRTVDMQSLNDHAVRETHHTESPFHLARAIPAHTYKSTTDAWNGYHSVWMREEDKHFTTFITPRGRYRYRVAPQGYIASGDGYTRRFDEIVADVPNKVKCIDDALLWSDSLEEAFHHIVQWLDICGRNGITLNPSKFQFAKQSVEFAGFLVTPNSVQPCPRFLEAIEHFPTPKSVTDVRSWFGLINQVAYAFASADHMLPFRDILKPNNKFEWTDELEKIFQESKKVIIKEIRHGVEIFDKSKPTVLATDWSKDGLGFWLLQKHCNCVGVKPLCCKTGWKITLVGGRFTSAAESRYAPIEGEALAVVDALKKARHFVLGCTDLTVATDHKPLLKVFGDRSLADMDNSRLVRLKEKTLQYRFKMVYIPGVKNVAADSISRHPVGEPDSLNAQDEVTDTDMSVIPPHALISAIRTSEPDDAEICGQYGHPTEVVQSVTWDDVRIATASDAMMFQLTSLIEEGFPEEHSGMHEEVRRYYRYRDHLTTFDGVVLYKDRVVIPPSLRSRVLSALHAAHQGVTQMSSRAESSIFWPGMSAEITSMRNRCTACSRIAPSQPRAPPTPPQLPDYPFQCIASDYFHHKGKNYLVAVDRYSNWPIVERGNDGSNGLIQALRQTFVTYGISEELSSDGGPQYTSHATQSFLKNWGVRHRLSSVAFPHSNCRAELAVKTVKRMILDNTGSNGTLNTDKFQRAMLQYRNTPDRETGLSPAMCIFGRPIRDFIPIHREKYLPHPAWRDTMAAREEALRVRHQKTAERLSEHTRSLPPLVVGDTVRIQNQSGPFPTKWDKTGVVVEVRQFDQYVVRVDGSRRVTLRNRQFLNKYVPVVTREPLTMYPGPPIPAVGVRIPGTAQEAPRNPTYPDGVSQQATPNVGVVPKDTGMSVQQQTPPRISDVLPSSPQPAAPSTPSVTVQKRPSRLEIATPPLQPTNLPAPIPDAQGKRIPLMLRNLQPHNAPGNREETSPVVRTRTFRSRTNKP